MSESLEKVQGFVAIVSSFRFDEMFDLLDDEFKRIEVKSEVVFGRDRRDDSELSSSNDCDLEKVSSERK